MANIILTGASGFLGTKIMSFLGRSNNLIITSSEQRQGFVTLDISQKDSTIRTIEQYKPDFIIHTAAYSNADECEGNPKKAYKINVEGTEHIAIAAAQIGAVLFHTSSVYIFDGRKGNYTENDESNPINVLGKTKLEGEKAIMRHLDVDSYVILRFPISYGYNGKGKNNAFFGQIMKGEPLSVNDDELRQPLLVDDLAQIINEFMTKCIRGVFNVAGPQTMTKYRLGVKLEKLVRRESVLIPVTSEHHYAPRPNHATLNIRKLYDLNIKMRTLEEGIEVMKEQLRLY